MEDGGPSAHSSGLVWDGVVAEDDMFPMTSDAADLRKTPTAATASEAFVGMPDGDPDGGGGSVDYDADAEGGDHTTSDAAPVEAQIFVAYKRRISGRKGPGARVGPLRDIGAVETAIRSAAGKSRAHIFEPVPSTSFDSVAEAYDFYNLYSWEVGFGIRYGNSYTNRHEYRTMQEFVCQREGGNNRARSACSRCGCKAMIRLHRSEDHGWFVVAHKSEHNHPLSENCGEKMNWNSHKRIDQTTRDTIRYFRENNVSLSNVHCILGSMAGSMDNLPFTKKSLRTVCQKVSKEQRDDDIKKTMDLFRSMHASDPDFAFKFDTDGEGRIVNLIWTSGRSRRQYACFGDVVVFDTTYNTNLYKMPFGLFVGVNNHFQTIIYAGILMKEETIESFNWAYREFVSLMGGKPPVTMLTDQCRAMEVAIATTLPGTTHRWCKWHVFRKVKEELGGIYSKAAGFKDAFYNVVNEMLTVDEFENAWYKLIEDYNLSENSFMIRVFEARHKWAKPFFKDIYCARMTSTQRVESANHMLKVYVPKHSSMNKFVSQYQNLLRDRNEAEDTEEHMNRQGTRAFKGGWPIERHARKIYTRAMMKHFKEEMDRGQNFNPSVVEEGRVYELKHAYAEHRPPWARSSFVVHVEGDRFNCECGLYTHSGMLCGHVIRLMIHLSMRKIPEAHIMQRWTKDAREISDPVADGRAPRQDMSMVEEYRRNILQVSVLELVKMGKGGDDSYRIVMKHVNAAKRELKNNETQSSPLYYSSGCEADPRDQGGAARACPLPGLAAEGAVTSEGTVIKEPLVNRSRGRPKTTRMKSFMDTLPKKSARQSTSSARAQSDGLSRQSNFCSMCRMTGHNSAACPENVESVPDDEQVSVPAKKIMHPRASDRVRPEGLSRQTKFCRKCRRPGHNSATCPENLDPTDYDEQEVPLAKPRRRNRCRRCQVEGHNAATCTSGV